ncbi:hypothetical protein HDU98_004351 [Podochytrium sp. JEL0797]|nr:hypothetical protein HDU98_004351 [Podochytrium sp. JEL0797]
MALEDTLTAVPTEEALMTRTVIADPSGANYNWTQTEANILFSVRVGPKITAEDVKVECQSDSVSVSVKDVLVIKGRLYATIADKSDVMIRPLALDDLAENESDKKSTTEKRDNPYFNVMIIRLFKNTAKNGWPLPIQGGVSSNTDTDPHSLYLIANALHNLNDSNALKMMNAAAELGSISAMLKLAAWFEIGKEEMAGIPVSKDEKLALFWHKRAGNSGNPEACYILMTTYASGSHNNPKSYLDALQWSRAAIQSGFGDADDGGAMAVEQPRLYQTLLFQTGLMLMEGGSGIGEPRPEGAISSWTMASKDGHAHSTWNLGIFHLNGFGLEEPNVTKGIELIRTGMKAVKELSLPPQLAGLNEVGLNSLIEMDAELRAQGNSYDVEKVKAMAALKKNGQLNSSTPKVAEPVTPTQKKNTRRRENRSKKNADKTTQPSDAASTTTTSIGQKESSVDWGFIAQKSVAVAAIGVGLFGLSKVLNQNQ